jgi:hypothetical protein
MKCRKLAAAEDASDHVAVLAFAQDRKSLRLFGHLVGEGEERWRRFLG